MNDNFKAAARAYENMLPPEEPKPKEEAFPPKWRRCRGCGLLVRNLNDGNLCEQCDEELA